MMQRVMPLEALAEAATFAAPGFRRTAIRDDQLRVLQDSFSRLTQQEGDTPEQLLDQIEE